MNLTILWSKYRIHTNKEGHPDSQKQHPQNFETLIHVQVNPNNTEELLQLGNNNITEKHGHHYK